MRRRLLLIVAISAVLVGGVGAYFWNASQKEEITFVGFKKEMADSIKSLGGARAYAAFKEQYADNEFSEQHNAAHAFGEVLFDMESFRGIAACDTDYNYGCYHGFMTEAIARKGFGSIERLKETCQSTAVYTACEHGIGHGIVEYLGHRNIEKALAACDPSGREDPVAGCLTGIYMEYNVPVLFEEDGTMLTQARPVEDKKNPYDLCTTVEAQYQPACYFSLAQWWKQSIPADYDEMGVLCDRAPAERLRCFQGIGNIAAPSSDFMAAGTLTACLAMPNQEGKNECLISAAGGVLQQRGKAEAEKVCAALPPEERFKCGV